jgi:hypothetical protein
MDMAGYVEFYKCAAKIKVGNPYRSLLRLLENILLSSLKCRFPAIGIRISKRKGPHHREGLLSESIFSD